jgi:hypothetical protein
MDASMAHSVGPIPKVNDLACCEPLMIPPAKNPHATQNEPQREQQPVSGREPVPEVRQEQHHRPQWWSVVFAMRRIRSATRFSRYQAHPSEGTSTIRASDSCWQPALRTLYAASGCLFWNI